MTHIEKMRLQAALKALSGKTALSLRTVPVVALNRGLWQKMAKRPMQSEAKSVYRKEKRE